MTPPPAPGPDSGGDSGGACGALARSVAHGAAAQVSPARQAYFATLTAVFIAVLVFEFAAFVSCKQRHARTRVRKTAIVFSYGVAVLLLPLGLTLPFAVQLRMPCWLVRMLTLSAVPLLGCTTFVRNSVFLFMTRLARATFLYGRVELSDVAVEGVSPFAAVAYCFTTLLNPNLVISREDAPRILRMLRFLTSARGVFLLVGLLNAPFFVAHVVWVFTDPEAFCTGCTAYNDMVLPIVVVAEGLPFVLFAGYVARRFRALPDPWGIFHEARLTVRGVLVGFIAYLIQSFAPLDATVPADLSIVIVLAFLYSYSSSTVLQLCLAARNERSTLPGDRALAAAKPFSGLSSRVILGKPRPRSTPRSVVASSGAVSSPGPAAVAAAAAATAAAAAAAAATTAVVRFQEGEIEDAPDSVRDLKSAPHLVRILQDPRLQRDFQTQLEQEMSTESLAFILDTSSNWRRAFGELTPASRAARAKKLAQLYLLPGALYPVNLSGVVMRATLAAIDAGLKRPETLELELFDEAREELALLLEHDAVARFLQSNDVVKNDRAIEAVVQAIDATPPVATNSSSTVSSPRTSALSPESVFRTVAAARRTSALPLLPRIDDRGPQG